MFYYFKGSCKRKNNNTCLAKGYIRDDRDFEHVDGHYRYENATIGYIREILTCIGMESGSRFF